MTATLWLPSPLAPGHAILWSGGDNNHRAWLGRINGKWNSGNPTRTDCSVANNERHRMEVRVRRHEVEGYLDGKRLCSWQTNGDDMVSFNLYTPRSPALMAVGSSKSEVAFHSVDVTARGGLGIVAREHDSNGWVFNPLTIRPASDGTLKLPARSATVHGPRITYDGNRTPPVGLPSLQDWTSPDDYVSWFVDGVKPGDYSAQITYACAGNKSGSDVEIGLDGATPGAATLMLHVQDTGGWEQYRAESPGKLHLSGGRQMLVLKATSVPHGVVMNVREVVLTPVR